MSPPRSRRRLALGVLLAAVALAAAALPVRATWWGGWILAVAEAGIVGGLADWFAVTAIFRRPLGLPIPHTAIIPTNWKLLAARVGTMVGDRVLTRDYLAAEIARLDVAAALEALAARVSRDELGAATRALARWLAGELTPEAARELVERVRGLLVERPVAPVLAGALDLAREQGWDRRAVAALAGAVSDALEREDLRAALADLVDEVLVRYRQGKGRPTQVVMGLADALGLIDRERIVGALVAGVRRIATEPEHPVRTHLAELAATLPERLRTDDALAKRVEDVKTRLLGSAEATRLLEAATREAHRAVVADLGAERSAAAAWLTDRLEGLRRALAEDAPLRARLDAWLKARALELVDRYHAHAATFIERGVHALGPEGAVRLIEEHAGDDLQYIRVNGTLVGGLAGGALYGLHLLVGWLTGGR
jgi:uncharacterized membrane-anchored protein YjiN (DUF445 family)